MNTQLSTEVSEYEQLRLINIQRNEEFLQQIGIQNKGKQSSSKTKTKSTKRVREEPEIKEEPTRRSSRVATLPVVIYTEVSTEQMPTIYTLRTA